MDTNADVVSFLNLILTQPANPFENLHVVENLSPPNFVSQSIDIETTKRLIWYCLRARPDNLQDVQQYLKSISDLRNNTSTIGDTLDFISQKCTTIQNSKNLFAIKLFLMAFDRDQISKNLENLKEHHSELEKEIEDQLKNMQYELKIEKNEVSKLKKLGESHENRAHDLNIRVNKLMQERTEIIEDNIKKLEEMQEEHNRQATRLRTTIDSSANRIEQLLQEKEKLLKQLSEEKALYTTAQPISRRSRKNKILRNNFFLCKPIINDDSLVGVLGKWKKDHFNSTPNFQFSRINKSSNSVKLSIDTKLEEKLKELCQTRQIHIRRWRPAKNTGEMPANVFKKRFCVTTEIRLNENDLLQIQNQISVPPNENYLVNKIQCYQQKESDRFKTIIIIIFKFNNLEGKQNVYNLKLDALATNFRRQFPFIIKEVFWWNKKYKK